MNYPNMLIQLNLGKKMRRQTWPPGDFLDLFSNEAGTKRLVVYNLENTPEPDYAFYNPEQRGMFANDWEELVP